MHQIRTIDNLEEITQELSNQEYQNISELVINSIRQSNEGEYTNEQIEELVKYMTPERFKVKLQNTYLVLCEEEGEIIGIGFLTPIGDQWQVKAIYIARQKQGKGIGKQILAEIEDKAKALDISRLHLEAINFKKTLEFYQSQGYEKLGPVEFEDGFDFPMTHMKKEFEYFTTHTYIS